MVKCIYRHKAQRRDSIWRYTCGIHSLPKLMDLKPGVGEVVTGEEHVEGQEKRA